MRLIRGAPGSGKTALVFREFKQAVCAGQGNARIVVPTATLVRHFRHELARDGLVFPPRAVISFSGFVSECAANSLSLVPDGLLRAIVRDLLPQLNLPQFAQVSGTDGMVDTIIETINLLGNTGCTPEALASIRKLGGLAKPFEKTWRAARDAVRTRGYNLRADWIASAAPPPGHPQLWFDGFQGFSPIERDFVGKLAASADLTITAGDSQAADEIRHFALRFGAKETLLTGAKRKPIRQVIAARSIEREADEIARRILALSEDGLAFREIGVALPESATWLPLLKGSFDRFGIPARFYFSSSLRSHPVAIFLNGMIAGALGGWDFEPALPALRAHPRLGIRGDFDRFEFAVREAMPGNGIEPLLACCESEHLKEDIAECLKISEWTTSPRIPAEWLRRLQSFATHIYRPGFVDVAGDPTGIEAARSHVAGLRTWIEAVSSIQPYWAADDAISLAEFWRVTQSAVEAASVSTPDDRANVVHVMNVYEARQWNVAALFICGMTERNFATQKPRSLIFPEDHMERLWKAGIPVRRAADYEQEQRWLFDALSTRASASVYLTYSTHDSAGKTVQRSRFIPDEHQPVSAILCRPESRTETPAPGTAGLISDPLLHREMAGIHPRISLTALEDLAQCRFKFFSSRTLALQSSPEDPDERLNALVTGSILHQALELWLRNDRREFVELYEQVFEQMSRDKRLSPGYRLEVERYRFRNIAREVSAREQWDRPDTSEAELPLTLRFDSAPLPAPVEISCRIDRLDRFGSRCIIVDYKSGKPKNIENLVASSTRLQGPLYALAVRENLGLETMAMIYWAVRKDETYGWGAVPGANLDLQPIPENWADDARARMIERLSGFLGGRVDVRPEEAQGCVWCDYRGACRVTENELIEIERAAAGGSRA